MLSSKSYIIKSYFSIPVLESADLPKNIFKIRIFTVILGIKIPHSSVGGVGYLNEK